MMACIYSIQNLLDEKNIELFNPNYKDKCYQVLYIYILFTVNVAVIKTLLYANERKSRPISASPKLYVHSVVYNPRGPPFDIYGDL